MQPSTDLQGTGWTSRFTRAIVWIVFGGSCAFGVAVLVAATTGVVSTLAGGRLSISLATEAPLPDEAMGSGRASIVDGGFDSAAVTVEGLSATPLVFSTISMIVGAIVSIVLASSLAVIAWRLVRGTLFTKSLWKTVAAAGSTALIGGVVAGGLHVFAAWTTVDELNGDAGLDGFWPVMASFDPGTIALGMGLLLVSLAFEFGASLQRDTEGLV